MVFFALRNPTVLKKYSIKSIFSQCILQKKHSGFLLIEIMTAITLLGGAVAIITSFCWHIIAWQHESNMRSQAITISSNIIETIKNERKISDNKLEVKPFSIKSKTRAIDHPQLAPFFTTKQMNNVFELELSISWYDFRGREKKHTIITFVELDDDQNKIS